MDKNFIRCGIMDTAFVLGEAVGIDTTMGEVLGIGDEW